MQQYQPYEAATAYSTLTSPEELAYAQQQALRSGLVPVEAIPQPQQQTVPRLSGDVLDRMYQAWETVKQGENVEAYIASRYYHSKQWTEAELRELKRRKQPVTTKNLLRRKVDFLVGVEQRLRRDPKCYPRTPAAEKSAEISTACLRAVEDETKWPSIASAASLDAFIRGIGVIWQGAKVVKGKAEVRKAHIPSDRFFYDPCSEAWDFSDARYMGEWQWCDIDAAIEMLPFAAPMIEAMAHTRSGGFSMVPQEFEKTKNWIGFVDASKNRIRIVAIWYKHRGNWMFDHLVGPISLCPEDYNTLSPYVDRNGISTHPYNAWSPYIDETGVRYGLMRDLIPIQDGINKRSSKMMNMLAVRQTMGVKGVVDDVDKMKLELSRHDGHVELNSMVDGAFQIIDQTAQIQGQFELLQEDKEAIANLGPNPALLGRDGTENQSGRAILAQQNSGMTELSPVFERLREWKLNAYDKDWNLIIQFWNGERFIRVTADPKAVEFLNINRIVEDPMTGQVTIENAIAEMDIDVILDEGPDTVTVREELMQVLANLGPGAVPPELFIELSNIGDKDIVLKRMQEFRQPDPAMVALQEKMAKLEMALNASKVDESQANVENKRAATIKTLVEAGAPPQVLQAFPLQYGQPTMLERFQIASAQQPQQMPMDGGEEITQPGPEGPPMNALLAQQQPPNPMQGGEPQLGAPGGLPLGPGVG